MRSEKVIIFKGSVALFVVLPFVIMYARTRRVNDNDIKGEWDAVEQVVYVLES